MTDNLTKRERMALHILFWILRILNPTSFSHQVDSLKWDLFKESERTGGDHD